MFNNSSKKSIEMWRCFGVPSNRFFPIRFALTVVFALPLNLKSLKNANYHWSTFHSRTKVMENIFIRQKSDWSNPRHGGQTDRGPYGHFCNLSYLVPVVLGLEFWVTFAPMDWQRSSVGRAEGISIVRHFFNESVGWLRLNRSVYGALVANKILFDKPKEIVILFSISFCVRNSVFFFL